MHPGCCMPVCVMLNDSDLWFQLPGTAKKNEKDQAYLVKNEF